MCSKCKHNIEMICTIYGMYIEHEYKCEDFEEVNHED